MAYVLLFPMSFFLISAYTESLFLLLVTAAMYYARKGKWFTGSIYGLFSAFTRLVGSLLSVVFFVEYLEQKRWRLRDIRPEIGFAAFIPLGLAGFMFMLKNQLGSSLLFFRAQEAWGRESAWPTTMLRETYWPLVTDLAAYADDKSLELIFDFFYFSAGAALVIAGFFFLRKSYALFALLAFIPAISSGTLGQHWPVHVGDLPILHTAGPRWKMEAISHYLPHSWRTLPGLQHHLVCKLELGGVDEYDL